ncbi:MAG: ECF transporter S component [Lachnospiraceae bacterium]|jgi:niacin transporter|nr:ECF transporter S component [Lachnospiraceae bacterium]
MVATERKDMTLRLVYGGILTALGVLLPQIFHIFGQAMGIVLLPMHIPVLLAGIICGPFVGVVVGFLSPVISSIFTGMPPAPKLYFMIIELVAFAFIIGILKNKVNIYINLILALIIGRIIYGVAIVIGLYVFHIDSGFIGASAFISEMIAGAPGMLVQLIVVPSIYIILKSAGLTIEKDSNK